MARENFLTWKSNMGLAYDGTLVNGFRDRITAVNFNPEVRQFLEVNHSTPYRVEWEDMICGASSKNGWVCPGTWEEGGGGPVDPYHTQYGCETDCWGVKFGGFPALQDVPYYEFEFEFSKFTGPAQYTPNSGYTNAVALLHVWSETSILPGRNDTDKILSQFPWGDDISGWPYSTWADNWLMVDVRRPTEESSIRLHLFANLGVLPPDHEDWGHIEHSLDTYTTMNLHTRYRGRLAIVEGGTYGKFRLQVDALVDETWTPHATLEHTSPVEIPVLGGPTGSAWVTMNISNRGMGVHSGYIQNLSFDPYGYHGEGGAVAGGEADIVLPPAPIHIISDGGAVAGGEADIYAERWVDGEGGAVAGGVAQVSYPVGEEDLAHDPFFWGWRLGGESAAFWGWRGEDSLITTAVPYALITGIKPYFQTTITVPDY